MVRGQTPAWNHTVQVWMMLERLSPGMEHGEEPDLGAQMFRVSRDL